MKIVKLALLMLLFTPSARAWDLSTRPSHLVHVVVAPSPAVIHGLGRTQRFIAYGWFSGAGWSLISSGCVWSTSDPEIAAIDSRGIATSNAYGGPIEIRCTIQ